MSATDRFSTSSPADSAWERHWLSSSLWALRTSSIRSATSSGAPTTRRMNLTRSVLVGGPSSLAAWRASTSFYRSPWCWIKIAYLKSTKNFLRQGCSGAAPPPLPLPPSPKPVLCLGQHKPSEWCQNHHKWWRFALRVPLLKHTQSHLSEWNWKIF